MPSAEKTPIEAGTRFGKWVVKCRGANTTNATGKTAINYTCICDCGREVDVWKYNLTSGTSKSCGCARTETVVGMFTTHGMSKSSEFRSWCAMKERCNNPEYKSYKHYGERGINYCEEWKDFSTFFKDMGARPEGMSLERRDTNDGYHPSNCVWATAQDQAINRRQHCSNTSGRTGVIFRKSTRKWVASIRYKYKKYYGGAFDTFEEAVAKREDMEMQFRGYTRPQEYEEAKTIEVEAT